MFRWMSYCEIVRLQLWYKQIKHNKWRWFLTWLGVLADYFGYALENILHLNIFYFESFYFSPWESIKFAAIYNLHPHSAFRKYVFGFSATHILYQIIRKRVLDHGWRLKGAPSYTRYRNLVTKQFIVDTLKVICKLLLSFSVNFRRYSNDDTPEADLRYYTFESHSQDVPFQTHFSIWFRLLSRLLIGYCIYI